jgi:hypothetical protein
MKFKPLVIWIWNQNIAISTIVGTSSLWNQNIAISTIVGTLSYIKAYHNTNILQLSPTITQIVIILLKFIHSIKTLTFLLPL